MRNTQYRIFEWNDDDNLICVGDQDFMSVLTPGDLISIEDDDDNEVERVISEVLFPNPRSIKRTDGSVYVPDPIIILKPE